MSHRPLQIMWLSLVDSRLVPPCERAGNDSGTVAVGQNCYSHPYFSRLWTKVRQYEENVEKPSQLDFFVSYSSVHSEDILA